MIMRFISLDFDKLMRIIIIPYGERVGETNRKKKLKLNLSQVDLSEKIVL